MASPPPPFGRKFRPGDIVQVLMGQADHCEHYKDVIHPVQIIRPQGEDFLVKILAFADDPKYAFDTWPIHEIQWPSGPKPLVYKRGKWIQFLCERRKVHGRQVDGDLKQVWVRGKLLGQNEECYHILYLNWETQRYESRIWVYKDRCRPDFEYKKKL